MHLCGRIGEQMKTLQKKIHPRLPYIGAELVWAVRNEMARTIEDLLSRRTRSLLLDAKASLTVAPFAVKLLAKELNKGES